MRYILALIVVVTFAIALTPRIAGAADFVTIAFDEVEGEFCYINFIKPDIGGSDPRGEVSLGLEHLSVAEGFNFRGIRPKTVAEDQGIPPCPKM
jgi:hypothetical protein